MLECVCCYCSRCRKAYVVIAVGAGVTYAVIAVGAGVTYAVIAVGAGVRILLLQ